MPATPTTAANPVFTTTAPQVSAVDVADIARRYYGLDVEVHPLTSERDSNFQITASNGAKYVLKIANAAEPVAVTEFQNRALLHIATAAPALAVPRVMPALDGRFEFALPVGGSQHVVRMLTYLEGQPFHKTPPSSQQRRALGACLAQLSNALASFDHTAAEHEILWDLKHADRLADLTVHIVDPGRRRMARQLVDNFLRYVAPLQPRLRAQIVHNDFNPHNVLVDGDEPARVTGVLDFGDMVRTPLVNDVAVACSYHVPESGFALTEAAEFVAAFHEVTPLLPEEVDVLFDLIGTRHAMTVTITEWRASRYPENRTYILRNNPRAVRGMEQCLGVSRSDATAVFRRACGME